MKWSELKKICPNSFVKVDILDYHMEENMKIIDDMALVGVVNDEDVTKELIKCDGVKTVVFHTSRDRVEIEVASLRAYRSIV